MAVADGMYIIDVKPLDRVVMQEIMDKPLGERMEMIARLKDIPEFYALLASAIEHDQLAQNQGEGATFLGCKELMGAVRVLLTTAERHSEKVAEKDQKQSWLATVYKTFWGKRGNRDFVIAAGLTRQETEDLLRQGERYGITPEDIRKILPGGGKS